MYRIVMGVFLAAGEVLAHPGHGAPMAHSHGWEYALLPAAIVLAVVAWIRARK